MMRHFLKGLAGALFIALAYIAPSKAVPVQPGQLDGCQYNVSPFTLSDGQQAVIQCDPSGNLKITGTVTLGGTGTITVVGNVPSGSTDSGNPVKVGGIYNSAQITLTNGQRGDVQMDNRGRIQNIDAAGAMAYTDAQSNNQYVPLGSNSGTPVGYFNTTFAFLYNGATWDRQRMDSVGGAWVAPATSSGTSNFSLISAATTNSTSVKAAPGVITELSIFNNSATIAYLKIYNSATAPTCGTGTPVARYLIPGNAAGTATAIDIALGKTFSTGIAFCLTGAIGDADTTAVAANAYIVNMTYK